MASSNGATKAKTSQPSTDELVMENAALKLTVENIIKRMSDQNADYRIALSKATALATVYERRAREAQTKLNAFENSQAWRVVNALTNRLNKVPILKKLIFRSLKVAKWTANGQLLFKVRQYRSARKFLEKSGIDDENTAAPPSAYISKRNALPLPLLDKIMSFMRSNGPIELLMAINFYAGGGAESAALEYVKTYAEKKPEQSVLVLMTDNGPRSRLPDLPNNIIVIDLKDIDAADPLVRESILYLIIRSISLKMIHIVNSILAYNLLQKIPIRFLDDINIVASVYALQFDPADNTKIIGYAQDFLPPTIEKIQTVVTDNARFAIEAPIKLKITEHASKFLTVYNKSKLDTAVSLEESLALLRARLKNLKGHPRLNVVWAGRLDKEKRVDLLLEIAKLTVDFCDFYVFGSSVVDKDYESHLEQTKNLFLCGPYKTPLEWDEQVRGNAFLFTSIWEGMPNTLIEASYLGYPVVAADVGGVSELVTSETGWLIDRFGSAQHYADALTYIYSNKDEAEARTKALIDLAHSRHNSKAYSASLSKVTGYGFVGD
ncbi:glycosyltransferase family 4 protein [Brucella pituitosa]|uniref:glycosyltransferase family 4 protein n=1 Tax=Brucella pituitosa TaxID=571256 RepID=UPI003F4AD018